MFLNINNNSFSSNLIILQWNVRSLSARLPSLMHLLHTHKCSIAILSETWLNPSRSISISFFRTYRSDRPDGFGGVAVAKLSIIC